MTSSNVSLADPKFIAGVMANTADQFLISYILLSRFEECGPHAATFAMAHCLELSIKAAYWHLKKAPPSYNHRLEELIDQLKGELGPEFQKSLPAKESRDEFKDRIDKMNSATFKDMLASFLALNPRWDDDQWAVLYALYRPVHIKYGVDRQIAVIQLMLPNELRLNRMALRLIGITRKHFVNPDDHRGKIRQFIARLRKRRTIIDALNEYLAKGTASFDPETERKAEGPFPRMTFDGSELELLTETLLG